MKESKFTDAQKAFIVKQGTDGTTVAEICRKSGISPATYFKTHPEADTQMITPNNRVSHHVSANGEFCMLS